jgi:hypothetical protein
MTLGTGGFDFGLHGSGRKGLAGGAGGLGSSELSGREEDDRETEKFEQTKFEQGKIPTCSRLGDRLRSSRRAI